MMKKTKRWLSTLSLALVILLPVAMVDLWTRLFHPTVGLVSFIMASLVAFTSVYLGWSIHPTQHERVARSVGPGAGLAIGASVLAWVSMKIVQSHGGGPVDPSLMGVIIAYGVAIWAGVGR